MGSWTVSRIDWYDEACAFLAAFGPLQIHGKDHIEDLERRRGKPNMKRQAFAAPGFLFEREEAGDEILVVFESRPPSSSIQPMVREPPRRARTAAKIYFESSRPGPRLGVWRNSSRTPKLDRKASRRIIGNGYESA
jgi:hypothetical protein